MRKNMFWGVVLSTALAFGIVGCGNDDGGTNTGGSGGSAGAGGSAGSGGTAGSGGSAGGGGMGGEGGVGGGMPAEIHGCTFGAAMDMTGMAMVTITDISAWVQPHNACVRVSAGTAVTWSGNFSAHPLVGGITPTADAASPITAEGANSGIGDATVTFDAEGTYPYFCEIHTNNMFGVIYVVP